VGWGGRGGKGGGGGGGGGEGIGRGVDMGTEGKMPLESR